MKEVTKHHSLSDWDIDPSPGLVLDPLDYHVAPSSLTCLRNEATGFRWIYLKAGLVADLPDGRFVTWVKARNTGTGFVDFQFRAQNIPETGGIPESYYFLRIIENELKVYRYGFGLAQKQWNFVPPNPQEQDEWEHWRYTFWQYTDANLAVVLRIVVEKEVSEVWTEQAAFDDEDNPGFDSGVNRIGFRMQRLVSEDRTNIDNTEVWRRSD